MSGSNRKRRQREARDGRARAQEVRRTPAQVLAAKIAIATIELRRAEDLHRRACEARRATGRRWGQSQRQAKRGLVSMATLAVTSARGFAALDATGSVDLLRALNAVRYASSQIRTRRRALEEARSS